VLGALTVAALMVLLPTVPSLPPLPRDLASQEKRSMPWGLISLVLFLMLAVTGVFAAYTYLGLILSETAGAHFVSIGLFVFGALGVCRLCLPGSDAVGDRRRGLRLHRSFRLRRAGVTRRYRGDAHRRSPHAARQRAYHRAIPHRCDFRRVGFRAFRGPLHGVDLLGDHRLRWGIWRATDFGHHHLLARGPS